MRRVLAVLLGTCVLVIAGAAAASADRSGGADPANAPGWCFEVNASGELPTCTWDGHTWVRSYDGGTIDDPGGTGDGAGGTIAALVVLGLVIGGALTWYKVGMARRMATRSGMDEDEATAMTLLTEHGLEATYLASNLRPPATPPATPPAEPEPPAAPARTAEERLQELARLRDEGLITPQEYDARRSAILDSL
jgi:putative oligomerization/nucleic acid binding protein